MFHLFIEPLKKSIKDMNCSIPIQIIVVDGFLYDCPDKAARRKYFSSKIGTMDYIHVSPKPTAWQGEYKLTPQNYFAAANTRNTGAAYAKYDYIAFVDDLGIIANTWLSAVGDAMRLGQIHCGAYTKVKGMIYKNTSYGGGDERSGRDHRLDVYKTPISPCPGGHMYGSSFCMPKKIYFALNGQNEMCSGIGGEDYDFGIRLERSGYTLFYNKLMFIHEYDDGIEKPTVCVRADPVINEEDYCRLLYGNPLISDPEYVKLLQGHTLKDSPAGRRDMSHFLLSYAYHGPTRVNPDFSLEEYNKKILAGSSDVFIIPSGNPKHFFTKKPLASIDCLH